MYLQGEIDGHAVGLAAAADDPVDAVVLILVLDEGDDAAFVSEHVPVLGLLIEKFNLDSRIEIGQLFKALGQNFVLEIHFLENFLVGAEMDLGAGLVRFADHGQRRFGHAPAVALVMAQASPADGHFQVFGQGVDHGDAYAVQAA